MCIILQRNNLFHQDLQFTDNKCLYLVYPVKGGAYNPVSKKIKKHESIPVISAQRICIRNCVPGMSISSHPSIKAFI